MLTNRNHSETTILIQKNNKLNQIWCYKSIPITSNIKAFFTISIYFIQVVNLILNFIKTIQNILVMSVIAIQTHFNRILKARQDFFKNTRKIKQKIIKFKAVLYTNLAVFPR